MAVRFVQLGLRKHFYAIVCRCRGVATSFDKYQRVGCFGLRSKQRQLVCTVILDVSYLMVSRRHNILQVVFVVAARRYNATAQQQQSQINILFHHFVFIYRLITRSLHQIGVVIDLTVRNGK